MAAHAAVILLPQPREKDLTETRASHNLLSVTFASIERSLTPFGMTPPVPTSRSANYFPDRLFH